MGDKQPINTGKMTITGIRGKKRGKLEERKQVKRGKKDVPSHIQRQKGSYYLVCKPVPLFTSRPPGFEGNLEITSINDSSASLSRLKSVLLIPCLQT